jgi:hypothetical protein
MMAVERALVPEEPIIGPETRLLRMHTQGVVRLSDKVRIDIRMCDEYGVSLPEVEVKLWTPQTGVILTQPGPTDAFGRTIGDVTNITSGTVVVYGHVAKTGYTGKVGVFSLPGVIPVVIEAGSFIKAKPAGGAGDLFI